MFAINTYLVSNSSAAWHCQGYLWITQGHAQFPRVSWQRVGWSLSPGTTIPLPCCFSLQLDHGYCQSLSKAAAAACAFSSSSYEFQHCSASHKELGQNYCFMSKGNESSQCLVASWRKLLLLYHALQVSLKTSKKCTQLKKVMLTCGVMSTKEFYCVW